LFFEIFQKLAYSFKFLFHLPLAYDYEFLNILKITDIVTMSNNDDDVDDSKEKFEEKITNSIQGILRLTILVNF
jgi:hypothetical protein